MISGGRRDSVSWMNRSKASRQASSSLTGGGTNNALPGLVPPIQFCERRNSPGSFFSSATALQETSVKLANQPKRQRKLLEPLQTVHHRVDIVRDFANIVDRLAGLSFSLETQEVREGRLRSLDLR